MINLNELRAADLKNILRIRQKIEVLELEMAEILQKAEKREPPLSVSVRKMRIPRTAQPTLRAMISQILMEAGKPLSVPEIYELSVTGGYQWRSQDPINALNVKMYTDKTFKKASPGRFVLRTPAKK
jgi:hypothetical protein